MRRWEGMRERKREIRHFRDLEVYEIAFGCAISIFEITKSFPIDK